MCKSERFIPLGPAQKFATEVSQGKRNLVIMREATTTHEAKQKNTDRWQSSLAARS